MLIFVRATDADSAASPDADTAASAARSSVARIGLTVSSKVGNAVERNRVKRWLREAWRRQVRAWPHGVDVVIIAKRQSKDAGYDTLARELRDVARRVAKS